MTVLFTDLVGSTDLLSRLGEVTFDELRRAHFAALRTAIDRAGGEEIKTLGDGVLAVFGSAADAVSCAVAMQQAVDRQSRTAPAPLAIRAGLALGDVSFEESDVFGAPVVEAARVVAHARPGQVLATGLVRAVAAGRSECSFTDLGTIELKGLPEPVAVCEVVWVPLPQASVPLPSLLTDMGRIFIEVERLRQLWKEAAAGERRAAFLAGEPGVGKTRLAAEVAHGVHAEGALVLAGRCDEDLGVPYQPFVEALNHYLAHAPEPRLGRYGGELARLAPEVVRRQPGLPAPLQSDPETERYRLFDAVASWLADVSAETPALVILDDLQWAAKPTLLLLRHVLRSSEQAHLLIVATYRDSDIHRGHPLTDLLSDLRRVSGAARLPLVGLDASSVTAFLQAAVGHELDEEGLDLARAVWAETEGNPFFVVEVLRHLSESGALERRAGRWTATPALEELGIPEGVRDVVSRRLSRLSPSANQALALAAVVGLEFELAVVAAAGRMAEDDLVAGVEEAVSARLVVELPGGIPRNRFSHALVRATLYDELSAGRRVALHRKVAEAIEAVHANRLDDYLPALAHHWARSSAPAAEVGKAVDYATRAGHRALAQLAHDEAVTYYASALELLDAAAPAGAGSQRMELLISLGEAQRRAGEPRHRETLLEAARLAAERNDAGAMARAALANNRGILMSRAGSVDHDRVGALEAALDAVGDSESPTRARLLANLALELAYSLDRERRVALSDEAVEMARRLGDPATLAHVLIGRFFAVAAPSTQAERYALTAELVTLAEQVDDPAAASWAWLTRSRAAIESGDIEEADRAIEVFERLARALGQPTLLWAATWSRGGRLLLAGDIETAERRFLEALEVGRAAGEPDPQVWHEAQLFEVRLEQGRLGEQEASFAEMADQTPGLSMARSMLARLHCELDHPHEARALLQPLAESGFDLPVDIVWTRTATDWAAVCSQLGDAASAAILSEMLAPYAHQMTFPAAGVSNGAIVHYLALLDTVLGRFDEAERHFAEAEAAHERIGAPVWLARSRVEWARMLLARRGPGDADRARQLLDQALTTARELSLRNVERRAVALRP